jgi:hypothetical protein
MMQSMQKSAMAAEWSCDQSDARCNAGLIALVADLHLFQTFPCTVFHAFLRRALKASFPCQSKGYCM